MPAAKPSDPRPKKCWLLTLHPPVSACRMVTCVNPCQCLTLLSDPINKSRKMSHACGQSQRSKTQKNAGCLTLHPPVNACRMVTCVTPCQCLTLLMLTSNASSPCQRVSNGYLCQPLPVPNVAF